MDETIVYIKNIELKVLGIEDIELVEVFKMGKLISSITCQVNYEDKNLDINLKKI